MSETQHDRVEGTAGERCGPALPVLEARGIAFRYPGGFTIPPFDLRIHPGEHLLLFGPPGSGKTTLLKLLARRLAPSGGTLVFRQGELQGWKPAEIAAYRRRIGVTDQEVEVLGDRSVRGNIYAALGARGVRGNRLRWEAMELMLAFELLPLAETRCDTLSTGQRRLVQLSLALSGKPGLVLLDEPLNHLPAEMRGRIYDALLEAVRGGAAMIMATHDESCTTRGAGRALRIDEGRLQDASGNALSSAGGAGGAAQGIGR